MAKVKASDLKGAMSALKEVQTTVTMEDGTTYSTNIRNPKPNRSNVKKKAPPAYLESGTKALTAEPSPRFDFGDPEDAARGLAYLEEHGYVVAKAVMSPEEVRKARGLFWDFVEGLPARIGWDRGNRRDDPSTWTKSFPGSTRTGIVSSMGAGQAPFSWYVRTRPRVKPVFEAIWNTKDLIVSFDGFNAFRPWNKEPGLRTAGGWYHVDQNVHTKPGKVCVQGLVSMYDQSTRSGGLTIIPGSHKDFKSAGLRINPRHRDDFVPIPRGDPILRSASPRLVVCKAGDMCLWDSRTVHCNSPGFGPNAGAPDAKDAKVGEVKAKQVAADATSKPDPAPLLRLACYVCMTPTRMATGKTLNLRRDAVKKNRTTTHWPHELNGSGYRLEATPGYGDAERYIDDELVVGQKEAAKTEAKKSRKA